MLSPVSLPWVGRQRTGEGGDREQAGDGESSLSPQFELRSSERPRNPVPPLPRVLAAVPRRRQQSMRLGEEGKNTAEESHLYSTGHLSHYYYNIL